MVNTGFGRGIYTGYVIDKGKAGKYIPALVSCFGTLYFPKK